MLKKVNYLKLNRKKLLILLLASSLSLCACENNLKQDEKVENESKEEVIEEVKKEEQKEESKKEKKKKEENENNTQSSTIEDTKNTKEEEVVTYFLELEKDIENELIKENGVFDTIKEKCAYFVLFMSNEKEIKGYTWSELTEETKEKIVAIFLKVDSKMCEKYPDYMEKIKDYSKKASVFVTDTYKQLKEKTNTIIDDHIDSKTQEEIKSSFKEGYEDLKESTKEGLEYIKKWARSNS